jgi:biotin operon repressor
MFVLTADQVRSRSSPDAVDGALDTLRRLGGQQLALAPERTVGDEVQVATVDACCAVDLVLALTRNGAWSIGCGVGDIEPATSPSIRAARGPAFIAAREAVDAAKKRPTRFALRASDRHIDRTTDAADAQAFVDLVLSLRARRSDEGWEVFDLISGGSSQRAIAGELGISEQAVSQRAQIAQVSLELEAVPALGRTLARLAGQGS